MAPTLFSIRNLKSGFIMPSGYFDELQLIIQVEIARNKKQNYQVFKVPVGYFEDLENAILEVILTEKRAKKSFQIPENYFENIDKKIFEKLRENRKKSIFTYYKFWIPAAVAAILLVNIGVFYYQQSAAKKEMAELTSWVENSIVNMNPYEIATAYETELEEIEMPTLLNKEEIEDYLHQDIEEIYLYD